MESLYVDESGSMTAVHFATRKYFVICIVRAKDPEKLKKAYKRFVSSRLKKLKAIDDGSMFSDNEFRELKGNTFTPDMKRDFINYFCRNNYFELFYIIADNAKVASKQGGRLYKNTARAFNYLLKQALSYYVSHGYISGTDISIQLDERNEKTKAKFFLENYINTELFLNNIIDTECTVTYYDSCQNKIIQVADVFANIMYSHLVSGNYVTEIESMKRSGYIKHCFYFPYHQ